MQAVLLDAIGHNKLFYVHKTPFPAAHSAIM